MIAFRTPPLWVLASTALALSACSGSGSPAPTTSTPLASAPTASAPAAGSTETPAQIMAAVAALEANGTLPILDVSDSLGGTDANNNGIRDDIEAYIAAQTDSAPKKAALQQIAKALQSTLLLDTSNAASVAGAAMAMRRGVSCIWSTYDSVEAHDRDARMQQLTVNTMARLVAYEKFNAAMDGTVMIAAAGNSCD